MRISEVAALAGVSCRAIRHYHDHGVLPEPRRRANGYREYEPADLLRLLRVVRLTGLGLSLTEVQRALSCGTDDLRALLADVVADITERQAVLDRQRQAVLAMMAAGDAATDPELASLLAELEPVVGNAQTRQTERDVLELLRTGLSAAEYGALISGYRSGLTADRAGDLTELFGRFEELATASPDDPAVSEIADRIGSLGRELFAGAVGAEPDTIAAVGRTASRDLLLAPLSPAQRRCFELAEQRWEDG